MKNLNLKKLTPTKDDNNFRERFGFLNVKITGKAASANQEAADKFPDIIKKTINEKGYLPEQSLYI